MDLPWTLPASWSWQRFDQVARVASDLVDPAGYPDWPHIAPNHIESWTGRLLPYRTVEQDGVFSAKHRFVVGQILYSKIRPYLAKVVLADFAGLCSADIYPIDTKLEPRYLKWWMLTHEFTRQAAGEQARTVLPKINKRSLATLTVPVPPAEEQRQIVDILEDHLSRLDAADSALANSGRRLSRLRQATLNCAIAAAMSTEDTRKATLSELARVGSGATPLKSTAAYYAGGDIPWVTSGDLHEGLITRPSQFITAAALRETAVKLWPAGTLLVAMYGEGKTRGTVGELGFAATTNQACAAIDLTADSTYLRGWVRLFLEANYWHLRRQAAGGVQPNLSLGRIRSLVVPVPDPATIAALTATDRDLHESEVRLRAAADSARERSKTLRRSLLQAAFSGQLTGRSSDLERAEELIA